MRKLIYTLLLGTIILENQSSAAIVEKKVEYKEGSQVLEGIYVFDDAIEDKRPGILVTHDWMGISQKTIDKARDLAAMGYVAFVADVYGKGLRPKSTAEASSMAGKFKGDRPLFRKRMNASLSALKKQKGVDTAHIAAMGFCFGGTGVLELARSGTQLQGVVSFHGGLDSPTPADGKKIKAKVLVLHGAIDPFVKTEDLVAFEKELNDAKVDYQLVKYSGAVHAFTDMELGTDISKGAAYNEAANNRSLQAMKTFFQEVL